MKKGWLLLAVFFLLSACSSSEPGISKVDSIPKKVQNSMTEEHPLQLIYRDENSYYAVFYSAGEVSASTAVKDNLLILKFEETEAQNGDVQPNVFVVNKGSGEQDSISAEVNGKPVPFDNISS